MTMQARSTVTESDRFAFNSRTIDDANDEVEPGLGTDDRNESGLRVRSAVKAGGFPMNHSESGLRVRTGVKAAGIPVNHCESGLRVRTGVKAGGYPLNHSESGLRVRSA